MKTLEITQQKAAELYPSATGAFKDLLESEFGKAALSLDITQRVKTFEDACNIIGIDPGKFLCPCDTKDEAAFKKLKVIAKALNEGWQPDWTNSDQYKYYPWFNMSSGSGLAFVGYVRDYSHSIVGSRLCFKSANLAKYAGTQFIDLYTDFMTL